MAKSGGSADRSALWKNPLLCILGQRGVGLGKGGRRRSTSINRSRVLIFTILTGRLRSIGRGNGGWGEMGFPWAVHGSRGSGRGCPGRGFKGVPRGRGRLWRSGAGSRRPRLNHRRAGFLFFPTPGKGDDHKYGREREIECFHPLPPILAPLWTPGADMF